MSSPKVSLEELRRFFANDFPQSKVAIEEIGPMFARVRLAVSVDELRPGGTVSGPAMMAVADAAAYVAILAEIGLVPLAVTTSLHINFLKRPVAKRAIVGEATLVKLGKRLAVSDVRLSSEGDKTLVAQASITYSIPPSVPPET